MSTTEEPNDDPSRTRGSSKLLAEWGHLQPAAGATTDWMKILRAGGSTLAAPRLVVSGTALTGLARPTMLSGAAGA